MPRPYDKEELRKKKTRKAMTRKDEHEEVSSLSFTDKPDEDGSILFHTFTAPEL